MMDDAALAAALVDAIYAVESETEALERQQRAHRVLSILDRAAARLQSSTTATIMDLLRKDTHDD